MDSFGKWSLRSWRGGLCELGPEIHSFSSSFESFPSTCPRFVIREPASGVSRSPRSSLSTFVFHLYLWEVKGGARAGGGRNVSVCGKAQRYN